MGILYMLIVGLVVGGIAKLLMPGRGPGGILTTIFVGLAGSFIAGLLGRGLGLYDPSQPPGIIASVLGALLLLALYGLIARSREA